jgi:hypothetical protein
VEWNGRSWRREDENRDAGRAPRIFSAAAAAAAAARAKRERNEKKEGNNNSNEQGQHHTTPTTSCLADRRHSVRATRPQDRDE